MTEFSNTCFIYLIALINFWKGSDRSSFFFFFIIIWLTKFCCACFFLIPFLQGNGLHVSYFFHISDKILLCVLFTRTWPYYSLSEWPTTWCKKQLTNGHWSYIIYLLFNLKPQKINFHLGKILHEFPIKICE